MTDMTPDLIAAAGRGDVSAVKDFMATGVDWRAENQQALYAAAKAGHTDVVRLFLHDQILPAAEKECYAKYTNGFIPTEDEVSSHKQQAAHMIERALAENPPVNLLTLAMMYKADGAFRALCEDHRATVLAYAPILATATNNTDIIQPLMDIGVDPIFASGGLFALAVARGDVQTVTRLLDGGLDPNARGTEGEKYVHALVLAARIADPAVRQGMTQVLHDFGADIRLGGLQDMGRMVLDGHAATAGALLAVWDAQSELPVLMAVAQDAAAQKNRQDDLMAALPYLEDWYMYDFIAPMFDAERSHIDRWIENVRMTDRNQDDGFLLKMAVLSPKDTELMSYLLSFDAVNLNTHRDRPLTLAVLTGKNDLLAILAEEGADLFAARSEAFDLAAKAGQADTLAILQTLAHTTQKASQKKLMQRCPDGMTPDNLRAGTDETGLHLAAKAGLLPLLADKGLLDDMTAEDYLKPSASGATVAAILTARREHAILFAEKLWYHDNDQAEKVWQQLSSADQKIAAVDYHKLMQHKTVEKQRKEMQSRWPRVYLPSHKPDNKDGLS